MGQVRFFLKNKTAEDEAFLKNNALSPDIAHDVAVCDSAEDAEELKKKQVAVICYERNEKLSGRYIIDSLSALDDEFIKKVHDAFYRVPRVILETERTIIRQCDPERDVLPMTKLYSKPHVTDYIENLYPLAQETVYQREYFDNIYDLYDFGMWNVFLKSTGKLIGRCGLEYMDPPAELFYTTDPTLELSRTEDPWLELGYVIDPGLWHTGLGFETTSAVMSLAIQKGHSHFFAEIDPKNISSKGLVKKLGFRKTKPDLWVRII